ncbi:hypothetical protein GRI32_09995 [Altererythrobacter aestuarii]|uniref:APC family permease n=2 Tax=Alteraurantiacibacter aestuarii TaxID=650004 RepID=A0A844ZPU0_9SPHN|nr:hypothetical protein [Alteraurantiacibacter aestuarii]MXO89070.1 hypothetical protein [Alteraurantiacibacter aestuarii]
MAGLLLLSPRFAKSTVWRATVTPLASIIGSGFLVLAPILVSAYGRSAPLVMAGLCIGAYLFGEAIRFNIFARNVPRPVEDMAVERLELGASWALVFAFMISVGYYLNLFGAFAISQTPYDNPVNARLLTSAVYILILAVGWFHGFKALERMEYAAVTIKLAVIAGLLIGLTWYFYQRASAGELFFHEAQLSGWPAVTLAFGLVITVQGFETSRYLGQEYDPQTRISSMRLAQLVCTAIYMIYIGLFAYAFDRSEFQLSETAIIDLMALITPLLTVMLVLAALAAQFSAAIADTSGSGGLVEELTRGRMTARYGYVLLVFIGIVMTWEADVFQIIAYASRAFALYYTLQSAIAARRAFIIPGTPWHRKLGFCLLVALGAMIVLFGNDVESSNAG